MVGVLSHYDKS